jgi:L-alanine-DL-glutamate epimerase-like enolase superfamily enzyme
MAGCRNFFLQEWEGDDDAVYQELCQGTYPLQKDGAVRLPAGPGLGLTVNFAEFTRRFPYQGIHRRATLTK